MLKVKIVNSTPGTNAVISPVNATFDKATNPAQDINVSLTLNGRQLTSITKGDVTLVSGQNYTASRLCCCSKQILSRYAAPWPERIDLSLQWRK